MKEEIFSSRKDYEQQSDNSNQKNKNESENNFINKN